MNRLRFSAMQLYLNDFSDPLLQNILLKIDQIPDGNALYVDGYIYEKAIRNEEKSRQEKAHVSFVSSMFDKHGVEVIEDKKMDVHAEVLRYAGYQDTRVEFVRNRNDFLIRFEKRKGRTIRPFRYGSEWQ